MASITPDLLNSVRPRMIDIRRKMHRNPELGFEEVCAAADVAEHLREIGLEVHECIGRTGVVGVLNNGTGNSSVMLRADMDALPITETSTHDYASGNDGKMHACGHDGHTAMLLGAAEYLCRNRGFDGTVYFIFQPNEENGLGAKAMIADGLLSRFRPDEVYGMHNLPGAPIGEISTRPGTICASESGFEFKIEATGGHSSMPHLGVDAIVVGSDLVQALQAIVSRKLAPSSNVVISVTEFITDGKRNVLPGQAVVRGDVRAQTPDERDNARHFMAQVAAGVAAQHNVKIDMSFKVEFTETINAQAQTEAAAMAASSISDKVIPDRDPMPFSEDFGALSAQIPGCFVLIGNGEEGCHAAPLHSSHYDFNEDALTIGAAFWVRLVQQQLPL